MIKRYRMCICAVVLVGLTCTVSGCSTGDEPASDGAVAGFKRLLYPPVELERAETRLAEECMREAGFETFSTASVNDTNSLGLTGPLDEALAQEHGYGDAVARGGTAPSEESYLAALSKSEQARYAETAAPEDSFQSMNLPGGNSAGTPTAGCWGNARATLFGDPMDWLLVSHLAQAVIPFLERITDTPEVVGAVDTYATCMADHDIDAGFPGEARELAHSYYRDAASADGRVRKAEKRLAVADAHCRDESDLSGAYADAAVRLGQPWIDEHAEDVLDAAALLDAAVARLPEVLGQTAG